MKKLVLLILMLFSFFGMAQRDKEHWFAPMMDRAQTGTYSQSLYFSTDITTPFPVTIYNNNAVIGTVTISKGNPQKFAVTRSMIITTLQNQLFTPVSLGLYTKADQPYFANLRIATGGIHAEILTSKGKAGIGNLFYVATTPINNPSSIMNFTTGILATEDNTHVTVSGYKNTVRFSNNPNTAPPAALTFTLNKGQSYIIDGLGSNAANATSFIGAKIVSDKPVSVTNGNFNGNFATPATSSGFDGSDIIMDQSVPVNRLGNEFGLIKGNGNIGVGMEGALVVATEDNTQIFVNNATTPITTLNTGDFYRVLDNNYIDQGNGNYNMYIKSTKNVYVYELLAGVASSNATLGFNYIPPLNCFLPKQINEIGLINDMNGTATPTKLNILTQVGASVLVNGNPPTATQGPYPLPGTPTWVTYSIPNITGNITVTSDKAVTAGISAGSGAVGYGGYFAGFSTIPVITKQTGTCIPGIILEVSDGFDSYQWNLEGVPIPGATSNTYTPLVPGHYTVTVTMIGCGSLETPVFTVYNCPVNSAQNIIVCDPITITPTFTVSTQTPVPGTVTITTAPTHGTAAVNPTTGIITYTPAAGYSGPDTIAYSFCGNNTVFPDCENVTATLDVAPLKVNDAELYSCNINGLGYYDLTTATITTNTPVTKKYYKSLADLQAGTNQISNPINYSSTAPADVFVEVSLPQGCKKIAVIHLKFYDDPVVSDQTLTSCYNQDNPKNGTFNLTEAVVTTTTGAVVTYYNTLQDATNGTNPISATIAHIFISPSTTVYAVVTNNYGCKKIAKITLTVFPPKYSDVLKDKTICVEDLTTLDAGPGFESYEWSTGETTQSISNVGLGTYWVILTTNGCETKQMVEVKQPPLPVFTNIDINNNTVTLTVDGGTPQYQYSSDGISWQTSNVFTNVPRGQSTFYVKDSYDCNPQSVEITVPNLINVITPNGDNVNDDINYSELAYKNDLTFKVYDRYGNHIFTGDSTNNYTWDGRGSGKKILTGTYWYIITWTEPDTKSPVKYSGWILVKNRN